MKSNQNIQWIILGDGRKKDWLQEEVKRLGLKSVFHILGSFPPTEMPNFFFHCDAMLVTLKDSNVFSLTVPNKIQSYLAFGKPVLGMLNGEGASIIEDANAGFSCNAGDYKQLAKNVERLYCSDNILLQKMGENAKKYCTETFNRSDLFKKFEKTYSELHHENL
ncbi:MAG: glycosyltransferase [Bacteroidetes bacterium]|nr:glycosyltransferase [Bacteroidota bacterium]